MHAACILKSLYLQNKRLLSPEISKVARPRIHSTLATRDIDMNLTLLKANKNAACILAFSNKPKMHSAFYCMHAF